MIAIFKEKNGNELTSFVWDGELQAGQELENAPLSFFSKAYADAILVVYFWSS